MKTQSGQLLDPLFDKLFVLMAMAAFLQGPYLGWAEFAILVARDVYVGVTYVFATLLGFRVPTRARPPLVSRPESEQDSGNRRMLDC